MPIVPILGQPSDGYEIGQVLVSPSSIQVEGPESRLNSLTSIATIPIRVDRKESHIEQAADLDVPDPQIRLQHPSPVNVKIEVRRKIQH